jgi:hypothetical protein
MRNAKPVVSDQQINSNLLITGEKKNISFENTVLIELQKHSSS